MQRKSASPVGCSMSGQGERCGWFLTLNCEIPRWKSLDSTTREVLLVGILFNIWLAGNKSTLLNGCSYLAEWKSISPKKLTYFFTYCRVGGQHTMSSDDVPLQLGGLLSHYVVVGIGNYNSSLEEKHIHYNRLQCNYMSYAIAVQLQSFIFAPNWSLHCCSHKVTAE